MDKLTDKEILSLEAVLYTCAKNKRTVIGGTFVKNIRSDNPQSISFDDAMINVSDIIDRFYRGRKLDDGTKIKTYLFYVRKYSIITNDYELYVYRCETDDPYHVMGEIIYRSETQVKRIDFVEQTEAKLKFWKEQNKDILTWKNKY